MIIAHAKISVARMISELLEDLRTKASRNEYFKAVNAAQIIENWFNQASSGDACIYYQSTKPLVTARVSDVTIDLKAKIALALAEVGFVLLVQFRLPDGQTEYRMKRTNKGFVPAQAMHGTVGSTPSPKYNGRGYGVGKEGQFITENRKEEQTGAPRPALDQIESEV